MSSSSTPPVHTLLLSIKSLLASLTQWSQGQITEETVSDSYVDVARAFNSVVTNAPPGVDMTSLYTIPKSLRTLLEQCLSEDPSEETYGRFEQDIRSILAALLIGLEERAPRR